MGEIYSQEINSNDPEFFIKTIINEQNNYLHDNARADKDRMYSKKNLFCRFPHFGITCFFFYSDLYSHLDESINYLTNNLRDKLQKKEKKI